MAEVGGDDTHGGRRGDSALRASNYGDGLEKAHLPPAGEEDWWLGNQLQPYSPTESFSSEPIDGPANRLILRADLGRVFEEGHFCFVPKVRGKSGGDGEVPKLVFHVFNSTLSGQLPSLWQNRALHPVPATVAVECLFARFAWTVLSPHVFNMFFPSTFVARRLFLWSLEKGGWDVEEASPERCRQIWKNARSRSPRKRSATRFANRDEKLLAEEGPSVYDSDDWDRFL